MLRTACCFVLVLGSTACSDDAVAPSVTVKSASPQALTMSDDGANDLTIAVDYSDGDGDLGGGTAEIQDCRGDALITQFAIPQIAPPGVVAAKSPITGGLELYVDDVGAAVDAPVPDTCSQLGVSELPAMATVFCVILVDAAGHRGAGDCTAPIMLFP